MRRDEDAPKTGEKDDAAKLGCVAGLMTLLIQFPLFMLLMYGVCATANVPAWVWTIYWVYGPVGLLLGLFRVLVDSLSKTAKD